MTKRWTRVAALTAVGLVGAIGASGQVAQAAADEVSIHYGDNHASLTDRGGDYSLLSVCDEEYNTFSVYAYVDVNGDKLYYDDGGDDGHCETYQVPNDDVWRLTLCEDDWGGDTCVSADA